VFLKRTNYAAGKDMLAGLKSTSRQVVGENTRCGRAARLLRRIDPGTQLQGRSISCSIRARPASVPESSMRRPHQGADPALHRLHVDELSLPLQKGQCDRHSGAQEMGHDLPNAENKKFARITARSTTGPVPDLLRRPGL